MGENFRRDHLGYPMIVHRSTGGVRCGNHRVPGLSEQEAERRVERWYEERGGDWG